MKKTLIAVALLTTALSAQAADLTSCAATYTVASAAFSAVNENRNADAAAYYAGQARVQSIQKNWGGNQQAASSMYKQALQIQQSKFRSQGWPALQADLSECAQVLKRNNIQ